MDVCGLVRLIERGVCACVYRVGVRRVFEVERCVGICSVIVVWDGVGACMYTYNIYKYISQGCCFWWFRLATHDNDDEEEEEDDKGAHLDLVQQRRDAGEHLIHRREEREKHGSRLIYRGEKR